MDQLNRKTRTAARHAVAGVRIVLVGGLLSSCSPDIVRYETDPRSTAVDTKFSLVFVVHGDGNYRYHDNAGGEFKADEVAVTAAKRVAEQNPNAEVFIFHQQPRRLVLFLFPLRSGEFTYYRNGRLLAQGAYERGEEQKHFDPELELYRQFRADAPPADINMVLYYGHEIPEGGGEGYDASIPDRPFTIRDFAEGLRGFTLPFGKFDLMVLSTCFGGTPYTIGELGPFARTIVASPDNLHLSYLATQPLERLDLQLQNNNVPAFAQRFARAAFDRLTRNVQTAVSVAVYDTDLVRAFVDSVRNVYTQTLTMPPGGSLERCDCAELPFYQRSTQAQGVEVFYRPARFGRSALKENHSGWECWRERPLQAHTLQVPVPILR
ncbi:MAG: hypothetical protein WEB33_11540 [Bacteroidota bacterium]